VIGMAGKASTLGGPIRMADYLSIGLLSRLVSPALVDEALRLHGRQSQRRRDLPAHAVAYYVMAMSLYRHVNMQEVLRIVTEGMDFLGDQAIRRNVGKSGISAARTRLGSDVMATLAAQCLQPQAQPTQTHAFFRNWRLVSLDGSTMEVADQPANRQAFGAPGTQQGRTGYPQLRFTALLEFGTQCLFGVTLGGYADSEHSLARQSLSALRPGMLCVADRGFSGFPMWQAACETGADLLWRIPHNRKLPVIEKLADGSYLSQMKPAPATKAKMGDASIEALTVRVIDYRLPEAKDAEPIYRLITTILDPDAASAEELAVLYQTRWRIETAFAEIKTTLKGADVVLRSLTPELVRQEFWGLLLAHHAIRRLMLEAALARDVPPDRQSFQHTVSIVRRKLPASGAVPPSAV
ncbi:IS4 family transposase, partial [Salinisphaera sp. Q1T1-3]|uniref:IS4 family transposase n=1 Tax=Salinisphaera sp. Q1T1-3 TaxID=2321229 RepID=UPI000E72962C